jgi:hypothetical protein
MTNPYGLIFGPSSCLRLALAASLRFGRLMALSFFAIGAAYSMPLLPVNLYLRDYAAAPSHHSAEPGD